MKNILSISLDALGVKYTNYYTNKLYNEHPNKNSLFGLVSMLKQYGVVAQGFQLNDYNQMRGIHTPFVAHRRGKFSLVSNCEDSTVSFREEGSGKTKKIPFSSFVESFSGVVLTLEVNGQSIEPEFRNHRRYEIRETIKKTACTTAFVLLFAISCIKNDITANLEYIFFLFLDVIGLLLCWLLLEKQLNRSNDFSDRLCRRINHNGCNGVLDSNAAKIVMGISWSEIGFGYFATNLVIVSFFPKTIPMMALINMVLLPFTLISIGYQRIVIKQWCMLCLLVMAVVWLRALLTIFTNISFQDVSWYNAEIVCGMYMAALLSTHFIMRLREGKDQGRVDKYLLNHIKCDPAIFMTLLEDQPSITISSGDSHIVFGYPAAVLRLTVLLNPHCNPCAVMHKSLSALLRNANISLTYVFTSFNEELSSSSKYLIALYLKEGEGVAPLFDEWFDRGRNNREVFMNEHPVEIESPKVIREYRSHLEWAESRGLSVTPTVVVNGHLLPSYYSVGDLGYVIE